MTDDDWVASLSSPPLGEVLWPRMIVHELRGPITVIRGYASLLSDEGLSQEAQQYAIEVIGRRAALLGEMIDRLQGSLSGAREPAKPHDFDARAAAMQAIEQLEPRARLEGATVEMVSPSRPPAMVWAIKTHILCILSNLLTNALNYSSQPAQVKVEVRDVAGRQVEIAIRDHGIGVPSQHRERIFEPGWRLSRNVEGFGLGLAISRELAQTCGGSLYLEWSQPSEGSLFVLSLPRPPGP
jgi:signal transduction histidine kinase